MNFSTSDLQKYFEITDLNVNLSTMIVDSILLLAMSLIVSWLYVQTAQTLSNRKRLAVLLPTLALITMMIITIIKSSLALSLGLVGALSIVRFRSAIKDPEELVYIFLAIGLGLGMGASQRTITILFFVVVSIFIVIEATLRGKLKLFNPDTDRLLFLSLKNTEPIELEAVISLLEPYTHYLELKRLDDHPDNHEVLFTMKLSSHQQLSQLQKKLQLEHPQAAIVILNDEKLFA